MKERSKEYKMGLIFSNIFGVAKQEEEIPAEVCFVDVTDEELVQKIIQIIQQQQQQDELNFYKKLDERIPVDENLPSVWRMSMDHPVVYILANLKHIQPIHIIEDSYGDMVIYKDEHVQEAVQEMKDLYEVHKHKLEKEKEEEEIKE